MGFSRSTRTSETSPRVKLARQIAKAVRLWIERKDHVGTGDERHAVRPGDILVLVRQRGPLFEAIIRALKNEGIDVAGADRLVLTEHIAVMDLLALADAILLPEDDLALATVLKSPLFGLTEDELFALALDRQGSLRVSAERAPAGDRGALRGGRARCARAVAVRVLRQPARRRSGAQALPVAARARGQRRDRRVPQSRARL